MIDFMLASSLIFAIIYCAIEPAILMTVLKPFYKIANILLMKVARVIFFIIALPFVLIFAIWFYLYVYLELKIENRGNYLMQKYTGIYTRHTTSIKRIECEANSLDEAEAIINQKGDDLNNDDLDCIRRESYAVIEA